MPRAFVPSQHYDDITLSSLGERGDDSEHSVEDQQPFPLKSTLPSQYRHSQAQSTSSKRPALPRSWTNGPDVLQRKFTRSSGGEDDVTLSTDVGTIVDDYAGPSPDRRRNAPPYEEDSLIPGVGRGYQKSGVNGTSSYTAHRDILASSELQLHPSPATANRHERLRVSASKAQAPAIRKQQSSISSVASEGEDSESGNETTSTSTSSIIMPHHGFMRSKAESTGNHHAYTLTQQSDSPNLNRHDRPKLDSRALDEMDRAVKQGRAALRQQVPDSPSPVPSRSGTPRQRKDLRSRKEEVLEKDLASPSKLKSRSEQHRSGRETEKVAEGSNGSSQYAAAGTRKPSDGSSTGKKQAGTDGSTTGDTLVDDRGEQDYLRSTVAPHHHRKEKSPFMKLPSGQKMGRGVGSESIIHLPDLTGMSSALDSPVKTVLGVQHRRMRPEVIQARLLQTNETRLEEFNELANYVKSVEKNLDQTQKKVQAVEDTSKQCVREVDALRNEWSSWQMKGKAGKVAKNVEEVEELDEYEVKVKAINDHIAHLTNDLHSYQSAVEQMRAAKEEQISAHQKKMRERHIRQVEKRRLAAHQQDVPLSSSPIKQQHGRFGEEDVEEEEATRLEMAGLREQVTKVANEVERLRNIVEGKGVQRGKAEKSAHFAASLPAMHHSVGVGSRSPFKRGKKDGVRSSSLNGGNRFSSDLEEVRTRHSSSPRPSSVREFSDAIVESASDDEADETVNVRRNTRGLPTYRSANEEQDEEREEDDISVQAQSRAEMTFEAVRQKKRAASFVHDEKTCTVCGSEQKKERRRQARKERVRSGSLAFADEDDEQLLLSLLGDQETSTHALPKSSRHHQVVQRLLQEHLDEFYHHRLLYCELADELKQFEPSMNKVKRNILAEHVMEAVEGLEFRAKRINTLQVMVGDGHRHHRRAAAAKEKKGERSPNVVDDGDRFRRVVSV
ncbi:hypothetical protein CBS101457_006269 [Exobasidium rhododendri]|nr:hypothetical protein CBS101457_006269 [Exobasidium rhododendri]